MIANIHGDGEQSLRQPSLRPALVRTYPAEAFSDFYGDDDAMFRRLGRSMIPARVWIRNDRGLYDLTENPQLSIDADTLCQIGVHLVPGTGVRGGRFCQIVSGPHRGMRFEFKTEHFFHAEDCVE